MRKYAILGSLLILGMALAGRAVSLAQKPPILAMPSEATKQADDTQKQHELAVALPNVPVVDEPARMPSEEPKVEALSVIQPVSMSLPPPDQDANVPPLPEVPPQAVATAVPMPVPTAEPVPAQPPTRSIVAPPPGDDPMSVVDSFLDRNRKEAETSIQTLNQEAESLRARLQKVEAALVRWQGVSKALQSRGILPDAQADTTELEPIPATALPPTTTSDPAAPKSKIKWSKPESETTPSESKPGGLPPGGPLPQGLPEAPPAETKPILPAPPTADPGLPVVPTDPKPPVKTPDPAPDTLPSLPEPAVPTLPSTGSAPDPTSTLPPK